jgi:L-lactate dehydrogenase complex protein LldG
MQTRTNDSVAREAIFDSIRSNLASSRSLDAREDSLKPRHEAGAIFSIRETITNASSLVEYFKTNLEGVDARCIVVEKDTELVQALTDIANELRETKLKSLRIAVSDSALVKRLVGMMHVNIDELSVTPSAADVFRFDIGISEAQAGIAETGTLLLDSSRERHRLVSLVPPVHIAILEASQIVATLGEALSMMQRDKQVSPIVTLVTGPSRTADIELTLAIGVHGPQELYVLIRP